MDKENMNPMSRAERPNKKAVYVLAGLVIVALLAAAVFGYLWMSESREVGKLQESLDTSAQQIETLSNKTSDDTDVAEDLPASTPTDQPTSSDDENASIVKMVGAYAHTRVDAADTKFTMEVTKKELPFARVSVNTEEAGGYACVLKKADGLWVVLFCGQGVPMQSELDQWGVPASIS